MKYIKKNRDGVVSLVLYEEYLDSAREGLRSRVEGESILDAARNGLAGRETFHDARLDRLQMTSGADPRGEVWVFMRLRGPYFDRYFDLEYRGVVSFDGELPAAETDLLVHELRLEGSLLVHELEFDKDRRIEIACEKLRFRERIEE